MLPGFLMDADDDWQEGLRGRLYPWLHPKLRAIGKHLGVPMYGIGGVGWTQYVGVANEPEEVIEAELADAGFRRNPIAAYKSLPDGRESEGSWVLLHEDAPDLVAEGMQLHVTLFASDTNTDHRAIYAHYEDDWRTNWRGHLTETNFDAHAGVDKCIAVIDDETFLTFKDDTQ